MDFIKSSEFQQRACSPAVEEIIQTVGQYNCALKSGDLENVMSFFADDAVLVPEQQQPVTGLEAVRKVYASLFEMIRFNDDNVIHVVDAQVSEGMGFVRSHETRGSVLEIANGTLHHPHFRELWVLKKNTTGQWKITVYAYGIPSQKSNDPVDAVVW